MSISRITEILEGIKDGTFPAVTEACVTNEELPDIADVLQDVHDSTNHGLRLKFADIEKGRKVASSCLPVVQPKKKLANGGKGTVVSAGTAVQMTTSTVPCECVCVASPACSTAYNLFVGTSDVDNTSAVPIANEEKMVFPCQNPSEYYVDSDVSGADFYWQPVNPVAD